ncbi:hypothetical protein [Edaphobacter aggregans]|uniref:hypothetical protein n=1 Tax=Edaphobacter aggregans TaxID=570835 RepID=UPI0012F978C2|nr:hypothetical protein [Edaphobacter aggregans]
MALATGLEISMMAAQWLRLAFVGGCTAVLGLLMSVMLFHAQRSELLRSTIRPSRQLLL